MKREFVEVIEMFRIVFGVLFAFFSGIVLQTNFILSFLLLMIGLGFFLFRIEYTEEKGEQKEVGA